MSNINEKLEIAAASQYPAHTLPVAECSHKREGFIAGADWQKQKAIEAYIKTCDFNAPGCCGCKNYKEECDCEQLKDFIEELNC